MGYWTQDAEGHSFALDTEDPEDQLHWGDAPADVIDDALWQVKVIFLRDLGRLPSVAEILAGLKFSINALTDSRNLMADNLPLRPVDAHPLSDELQAVVRENADAALVGGHPITKEGHDAAQKINDVLERIGRLE